MLFSSMIFLWIFLPAVILINFLIKQLPFKNPRTSLQVRNMFLLFASLVFYAWGGIYYLLIMISTITINYFGGQLIAHRFSENPAAKKKVLIIAIVLNLAILFVFKYFNMMVAVIEAIIDPKNSGGFFSLHGTGALGLPYIVLPIGISFFTFQAMSYVVDVYRNDAPVQDNFFSFALYVSFFPQLIAGPIVRYADVAEQIDHRKEKLSLKAAGIKRFCYGLGKKVLLANVFAKTADTIFALETSQQTGLVAWLGIICYSLQIYYDFSGYSDMAIGLGRIFGFQFKENFNYPYISQSIREFWRRWHISLSTWFKEYVYIPLGGNRRGTGRTYLNLFIVFLLTGIWHGANFTFLAWGIYYGILLVLERLFLGKLLDKNPLKFLNHIYVIFAVIIGWVFFRADNIYLAFSYIKGMFTFGKAGWSILSHLSGKLILCLIIGVLFCGPMQEKLKGWYEKACRTARVQKVDFALQMILVVLSILALIGGTYNPFIYFQF